ncbi:MAG: hypothetical protein ACXV2A_07350 [Halobacteriota archaeon]
MQTITFLSDTDPDFKCLEDFLRKGKLGRLADREAYAATSDSVLMQGFFELVGSKLGFDAESIANVMPASITLPTRFESPAMFRLVEMLVSRIKSVASSIGMNTADFPHYSSVPTGLVNAKAIRLPCSTREFLLFDSQLFTYCNLFAKAFALCLPIKSQGEMISFDVSVDGVISNLDNNLECVSRFIDVLRAMDETEVPSHAQAYLPPREYVSLTALYRDGMELFVVAHEFGHVYAKHLSDLLSSQWRSAIADGNVSKQHMEELEADAVGLMLMCHAQAEAGFDAGLSYIGAELFFHALEMQDRFSYFQDHGSDEGYVPHESDSHPSHVMRRMMLRNWIPALVPDEEQSASLIGLADRYGQIVEAVWERVKRRIP